jgi:type IV pilus assembly protein PilM
MLEFVQNLLAPRANPIGVDFGSDCLRLAQVQRTDGDFKLIAAASADVPPHLRHDGESRLAFFAQNVRDLLGQGRFRGHQAILALPASMMHIQHLRLGRMEEEALKKAIVWESRGTLPIDPSQALLRHVVAGDIYHEQESKMEVIVMAAARQWIHQFLATAAKARLDVIGMNVEPLALMDCFSHIYRRKSDRQATLCFVDIGSCGTRVTIARDGHILFARVIAIGGEHLTRATADELKIAFEEAKTLRIKLAAAARVPSALVAAHHVASPPGQLGERRGGGDLAVAELEGDDSDDSAEAIEGAEIQSRLSEVEQACRATVAQLVHELDLCRRYYETTFPNAPVDRLIFVGGEARQRSVCQQIARELGLAAQIGDPMCRMNRTSDVGLESGLDRRLPQPAWAVALGLSMGPPLPEKD